MDEIGWAATVLSGGALALGIAADSALLHYSHSKLEKLLGDDERLAAVSQRLSGFDRLVAALSLFNSIATIFFALSLILLWTGSGWPGSGLAAVGAALLTAVVFEGLLRGTVSNVAERALLLLIGPIVVISRALQPIVVPLEVISRTVGRIFGGRREVTEEEDAVEEILDAVAEGEAEGVIHEATADFIENIMEYKDRVVREIMTPRTSMVCAQVGMSIQEIISLLNEHSHSRLPIYTENRDNIVGILYMKDLLRGYERAVDGELDVQLIMRRPVFVPESKKISDLLTEFQQQKVQIAIVLDEFGGTAGLVTVEDILEEIVGELDDEFDHEGPSEFDRVDEHNFDCDAALAIDDLMEQLQLEIPSDGDYDTVGGFLSAVLGKVPEKGEIYEMEGASFRVTDADERKVKRVRVTTFSEELRES